MEKEIENRLIEIFERSGIFILAAEYNVVLKIDSFQFVNILVDIETEFLINLFDKDYSFDKLHTFTDFYKMIMDYLK